MQAATPFSQSFPIRINRQVLLTVCRSEVFFSLRMALQLHAEEYGDSVNVVQWAIDPYDPHWALVNAGCYARSPTRGYAVTQSLSRLAQFTCLLGNL